MDLYFSPEKPLKMLEFQHSHPVAVFSRFFLCLLASVKKWM
jgi:hypothetical protein